MPGPAPKTDSERRRRNAPTFEWVLLPAEGRIGAAPKLPAKAPGGSPWSKLTRDWWADLWSKPQATQWDLSSSELFRFAALQEKFWSGDSTASDLAAILAIEDRHGLSPKSLLGLRWRIVDAGDVVQLPAVSKRRGQLKVVDGLA